MKTLPKNELNKKLLSIVRKGGEVHRTGIPSTDERAQEMAKELVEAINDLRLKFEIDSESLAESILLVTELLAEMAKKKKVDEKRKWIMDVIRDDEDLIKSVIARRL